MHSNTEYGPIESLFHTFAEFRLIVNRVIAQQPTYWLTDNTQFSPHERGSDHESPEPLFLLPPARWLMVHMGLGVKQ